MILDTQAILVILAVGLSAGLLGGLLGIGGSIIMIPGLALALHNADPEAQHLFQAAAMAVNVAVALPAALRHRAAGTVRADALRALLPAALLAIVAGVLLSNLVPGLWLRRLFAIFLVYVAAAEVWKLLRRRADPPNLEARPDAWRLIVTGVAMGLMAGVLGIGGGVIAVPLLLTLCRLPTRHAIGLSSAAMCLTAGVGAAVKIGTLGQHGFAPSQGAILAAALAPTAVIGGYFGATLTHKLPVNAIRVAMALLLVFSAWAMAGI